MKKLPPTPTGLPDLFDIESLREFLLELDKVNSCLLYRDPATDGWRLVSSLHGEGETAPELFRLFERDGQKAVVSSDLVNQSVRDSSAATGADQYELGTPKALQAIQSRGWSELISSIHFFEASSAKSLDHRRLHALMISRGFSDMILRDLKLLLASSCAPDKQSSIAKEAGAAYESGLRNFLTSIGARKKKGTPRKTTALGSIPWEWHTIFRTQQFAVHHGTLPTQAWLIKQLQQDGVGYKEENGREHSRWRELLKRAGLDSLPK